MKNEKQEQHSLDRFREKLTEFALGSDKARSILQRLYAKKIEESPKELEGVKKDKSNMLEAVAKAMDKAFEQSKNEKRMRKALAHIVTSARKKRGKTFKEEFGFDPPGFLTISPTKLCNLKCAGCYAISSSDERATLDWDVFDRIMQEKRDLWNSHFTVISGGEPLLYRSKGKGLLDIVEKHKDNFFLMYTNGVLINKDVAARMAELGNITPAISVEGYEKETDARRGAGTHKKILRAMENLKEAGVPFGISITAFKHNAEMVVSEDFIDYYMGKLGAIYAWIFQYMPIGREQTLDLQVTPEQRLAMFQKTRDLVKRGVFIADFWNSACVSSGCLSAGKPGGYLYIEWSGNITPCVFNPYSPLNIYDVYKEGKTLNDVLQHPFLQDIRKWQDEYAPPDEPEKTGNFLMPCAIRDHYKVMRKLLKKYQLKPIDESAQEALESEEYKRGLQAYDAKLKKITDPIWKREYLDRG